MEKKNDNAYEALNKFNLRLMSLFIFFYWVIGDFTGSSICRFFLAVPPKREINRAFPFYSFHMDCGALKEILSDPLLVIKLHNSLCADSDPF